MQAITLQWQIQFRHVLIPGSILTCFSAEHQQQCRPYESSIQCKCEAKSTSDLTAKLSLEWMQVWPLTNENVQCLLYRSVWSPQDTDVWEQLLLVMWPVRWWLSWISVWAQDCYVDGLAQFAVYANLWWQFLVKIWSFSWVICMEQLMLIVC